MSKTYQIFSKEAADFIISNRDDLTRQQIATHLGVSVSSVKNWIKRLNLKNKFQPFDMNKKYGKWTVLNKDSSSPTKYLCKCDCGKQFKVVGAELTRNRSRGCRSCRRREVQSRFSKIPGDASFNKYYRSYKKGAKDRKLSFELSLEQFKQIVTQNCHYTNRPPRNWNPYLRKDGSLYDGLSHRDNGTIEAAWIKINGIDRKDNTKGYTLDNCVPCAPSINWAKRNMKYDDFLHMAFDIADNLKK